MKQLNESWVTNDVLSKGVPNFYFENSKSVKEDIPVLHLDTLCWNDLEKILVEAIKLFLRFAGNISFDVKWKSLPTLILQKIFLEFDQPIF